MSRPLAIGAGVLAVSLLRSLAEGFGLADESWFLQVVGRLRHGDILYRDVAYPATPLAVYLTAALSRVVGLEIVAVKIVTNLAFAVTVAIADGLARRLGVSPGASAVLVGGLILGARPYANPPYTPVAMAMFVATLAAMLPAIGHGRQEAGGAGQRDPGRLRTLWIGGLAGLSFSAKQNVGGLALAAALTSVALLAPDRRHSLRRGVFVAAGFVVVTAIALSGIIASGGLAGFWEHGVVGRGAYIRRGGVGYLDSLGGWIGAGSGPWTPEAAIEATRGLVLVLPVAVALTAAWRWRRLDARSLVLLVFAGAALATAFPRWDRFHMAYAVPVHLLALVSMWRVSADGSARGRSRTWIPWLAAAALFGAAVAGPVAAAAGADGRRPSGLPHFRGPLLATDAEHRLARGARALADASGGQPVFILSTDAGFWYLASGVTNPTPFDIPAVTSVGGPAVKRLLDQLSADSSMQVCVDNRPATPFHLIDVQAWVRSRLREGPDVGPCTMYRAHGLVYRPEGTAP